MWNAITSGVVAVDQELAERVLRKKYQSRPACRMAARLGAGATISDVMDGNDGKQVGGGRGVTSWLDLFNEIALMRCIGMSQFQIGVYYGAMIVGTIVLVIRIQRFIPDSMWTGCNICSGPKNAQTCRPGTPNECKRIGAWMEFIIGLLVAIVALAIVRSVFKWGLKLQIYNLSALVVETTVRTVA